jgi:hypothetical protein
MSDLLTELTPLNLLEEKEKFFNDLSYNPQFRYSRDFTPKELSAWGLPSDALFEHAKRMLETHQMTFTSASEVITQEFMEKTIEDFNSRYQLEEPIVVHFSENQVSRCRINGHHIYFQLPITYTAERFADLCRHELETHVLRRINHENNFPDRKINEIEFRRTEEGLAGLHSFLFRKNKVVFKSYHTYSAVWLAQKHSFAEVYGYLKKFNLSDNLAWNITLRTKRGLKDSSQPGGFTKDICYLEGIVEVLRWVLNHPKELDHLYWGRLSIKEMEQVAETQPIFKTLLPSFYTDKNQYILNAQEITEINEFSTLEKK